MLGGVSGIGDLGKPEPYPGEFLDVSASNRLRLEWLARSRPKGIWYRLGVMIERNGYEIFSFPSSQGGSVPIHECSWCDCSLSLA